MDVHYLEREHKPTLAYHTIPADGAGKSLPTVIFMGGYRSDMTGTKATYLEKQCAARGQAYVRFDYRGHGESDGIFADSTIGDWLEDALAIFDLTVKKKAIIVGSSMGGWIALLTGLLREHKIAGLIGIAAAPDFTEELYSRLSDAQKQALEEHGIAHIPNDYSDEPYIYKKSFYEEAKSHLILEQKHNVKFPIRLIQGMQDADVPWETALKIQKAFDNKELDVVMIDDGDHRLSRPQDLEIIDREIESLS